MDFTITLFGIGKLIWLIGGMAGVGLALASKSAEEYEEKAQNSGPPEPFYIDDAKIASAKDVSGQSLERRGGISFDTAIMLELDIGKDFQPELLVAGDFKKDWDAHSGNGDIPRVKPLEWGSNFKVDELAARAGLSPLFDQSRDDNVIRDEVLEGLIGESVVYLRYVYGEKGDGGLGYTNHDRVRFPKNYQQRAQQLLQQEKGEFTKEEAREKTIEVTKQALEDQFLDEYEAGYVKDYSPEVIDTDDTDNNPAYAGDGAPTGGSSSTWDDDETFEPDDELPF